jgi:DNA replication protein DnaC
LVILEVGKSFLAKCIAYSATQAGIKTLFTTATDMINHLISAEADHSLLKKLHFLSITGHPGL